jgi:hypothetical protein
MSSLLRLPLASLGLALLPLLSPAAINHFETLDNLARSNWHDPVTTPTQFSLSTTTGVTVGENALRVVDGSQYWDLMITVPAAKATLLVQALTANKTLQVDVTSNFEAGNFGYWGQMEIGLQDSGISWTRSPAQNIFGSAGQTRDFPLPTFDASGYTGGPVTIHIAFNSAQGAVHYIDNLTAIGLPSAAPLNLTSAQIAGPRAIQLASLEGIDLTASTAAALTLESTTDSAYASPQALTLAATSHPLVVLLTAPQDLQAGHSYTLRVAGLQGPQGEQLPEDGSFTLNLEASALGVASLTPTHRISPYIYGMSFAPTLTYIVKAGVTISRWGGNHTSPFNWEKQVTNRGADWYFTNGNESLTPEAFIHRNSSGGATSQWSLAALPWVAKDATSHSFSTAKYGVQTDANPWNADQGNGKLAPDGTRILNDHTDALMPNRPAPADGDPAETVYQSEFLAHLRARFGPTLPDRMPFVAVDNEMDIWHSTHADAVHEPLGFAEVVDTYLTWARMIRDYYPEARIMGPVSTGWFFYWNAALSGERARHGMGHIAYFLDQVAKHDATYGARTLDILDLHYYPESGNSDSGPVADRHNWRIRSTREWWDPTYRAEGSSGRDSWWAPGEPNQYYPQVIPRMKALIEAYYPGTPLAFTEWNFGNSKSYDLSQGIAVAETLGVFGRHDVFYSTFWTHPHEDAPMFQAFALFRNPAGDGVAFGSMSLASTTDNIDAASLWASVNDLGTRLHLVLVNKRDTASTRASVSLPPLSADGSPRAYRFHGLSTDRIEEATAAVSLAGQTLTAVLPPYSVTHVIIPLIPNDADGDGMPDAWEALHHTAASPGIVALDPQVADADLDHDGDGFSSGFEALYGTDPLDPASRPDQTVQRVGNARDVSFFAPYDRTCILQGSDDLNTWTDLVRFSGTGGWITRSWEESSQYRFLRLTVLP